MVQQGKAQELRDLLKLAKQLRSSAMTTNDQTYIDLFMHAAEALEEHASSVAFGCADTISPQMDAALHAHIDIRC
jgi:hypothetical protein